MKTQEEKQTELSKRSEGEELLSVQRIEIEIRRMGVKGKVGAEITAIERVVRLDGEVEYKEYERLYMRRKGISEALEALERVLLFGEQGQAANRKVEINIEKMIESANISTDDIGVTEKMLTDMLHRLISSASLVPNDTNSVHEAVNTILDANKGAVVVIDPLSDEMERMGASRLQANLTKAFEKVWDQGLGLD